MVLIIFLLFFDLDILMLQVWHDLLIFFHQFGVPLKVVMRTFVLTLNGLLVNTLLYIFGMIIGWALLSKINLEFLFP